MDRNRDIPLAGSIFAHVLRLFIEAGIDRIALVTGNEAARTRRFGIHQPVADAFRSPSPFPSSKESDGATARAGMKDLQQP